MKNHKIKIACVFSCPLYKKEIAKKTVEWSVKRLGLSKLKKLNILVKIKTLEGEDCDGYCEEISHKERKYNIVISDNQNLRDFVMTVIHEMIHVKQYVRKEWLIDGEPEAWGAQEILADEIWKDNIL
tara:strand:+ start:226 stop:606 length:381 start_codon:yes stop_codon:yes gene_type:complete